MPFFQQSLTLVLLSVVISPVHLLKELKMETDIVESKYQDKVILIPNMLSFFRWMLLPLCLLMMKEITAGIMGLMAIHLLWYRIPPVMSDILIVGCTALALLSAVLYAVKNIRILKR